VATLEIRAGTEIETDIGGAMMTMITIMTLTIIIISLIKCNVM